MKMYEMAPDNYDAFEEYEAERERLKRMRRRYTYAYGEDETEHDVTKGKERVHFGL